MKWGEDSALLELAIMEEVEPGTGGPFTAAEVAKGTPVTPTGMRDTLEDLEEDGKVERTGRRWTSA